MEFLIRGVVLIRDMTITLQNSNEKILVKIN